MPSHAPTHDLEELLHRVFGHRGFRAHQQEVCEAATAGRDVLLVMPTGAGKSLCYQLPALARGGVALVISPLIALMDDQAGKLEALGLRVGRVHSGRSREDSRQACRNYLAGELDFLFIAPERMRVPGFPEMLAKRKPALVAIDEAHCISQWGHDFRPDYRTLGQFLPALRPAPIIALTATATPTVQRDIARQLELDDPAIFITGFRRTNLAVQVVELSKPQRAEVALKLLKEEGARPAIVYAGSRKQAEELAEIFKKHFPAAAYHAGLEAGVRERVQKAFLGGKLDVVVATIAFGMGVDKADVRTVVHVALPGSVEAYYQEIGRAGRDGQESRTVLLHGFADRRLQEFFLEKNYPPTTDVQRVAAALGEEFEPVDRLQKRLKMDAETLDRAIEKLLGQGVAMMDVNGDVRGTGEREWKAGYEAQVAARRAQIDRMVAYAEATTCRMRLLVEHFGDRSDRQLSCGLCDICRPESSLGLGDSHAPSASEREELRTILHAIAPRGQSTGKLFTELKLRKERSDFTLLLQALERAGLLTLTRESFTTPEGEVVPYVKASITHEGREPHEATLDTVWIRGVAAGPGKGSAKATKKKTAGSREVAIREMGPEAEALFARLKEWRTEVARPTKTPAFMILADAVMRAIAAAGPKTLAELHGISGMGPAKVDRYGAAILAVCRGESGAVGKVTGVSIVVKKRNEVGQLELQAAATTSAAVEERFRPVVLRPPSAKPVMLSPQMPEPPATLTTAQLELEGRLRAWRAEEAKAAGLPSFFILSDTVLKGIVVATPRTLAELRAVRGIEADKVERFGAAVVGICTR